MNSDFKELLATLAAEEVRYLVVGGYAVIHYAQPRYTKDLDIWLDASPENARRLMKAFERFGLSSFGLTEEDFAEKGTQLNIGMPPTAIDFLTSLPGLEFDVAWRNRNVSEEDGVEVFYLSSDHLLLAKRAAGRAQDLADIEEITKYATEGDKD